MSGISKVEVPIRGMDCAECVLHVEQALKKLPGVVSVKVFLSTEKAVLEADPEKVGVADIARAVSEAGYAVPLERDNLEHSAAGSANSSASGRSFYQSVLRLLGLVFGAVLFIVVVGEWLGLFEQISARVPWFVGLLLVVLGGYSIFRDVIRAALKKQVTSHTLMSLGVLAALAVGEWVTAAVVVFFMQVGRYAERFTTERARRAVSELETLSPQMARVERDGHEYEIPIAGVRVGDTVVVRPGEKIPVDGEVLSGQATIDQAAITGESMPVEAGPGTFVFAATLAQLGSLRIRVTAVGRETTFGKVVRLVEEAEANRADVQRMADRFSVYYLPVVVVVALLTLLLRRDPLAMAAVLVVACSCSFALATPIAMLASIGAGAKRGLVIKGGKYLELLNSADTLLVDKTGTLTLGKPEIVDIFPLNGRTAHEVIALAGTAEYYSEHPLAEAVRERSRRQGIALKAPEFFQPVPGQGVIARSNGFEITVGNRLLFQGRVELEKWYPHEKQGKSLLFVGVNGHLIGVLTAQDTLRSEVGNAIQELRRLGFRQIELLTGDHEGTAREVADQLGISYRAGLLPQDKIQIVREYQAQNHVVVMVGDGINDAPALAQADVGIAMGAAGASVAVEAAHIALMNEDWRLVPKVIKIAKRTMRVIKGNLMFTILYNALGLTLAALGWLPPVLAAALQSIPDLGILGNSSRLLHQD